MRITVDGFALMTQILKDLSAQVCNYRLALFLEGGYHLEGMAKSVVAIIKVLSGEKRELPGLVHYQPSAEITHIIAWHKGIWEI